MAARDHLQEGESILSALPPFYATNRRLLWYDEAGTQEEFHDLPYHQVESIELVRQEQRGLAIGGVILAFLGVMIGTLGLVTSVLIIALGVGLIIWGARGREGYYQFRGYQMSSDEQRRWRVRFRGSAGFITTVGTYLRRPITGG